MHTKGTSFSNGIYSFFRSHWPASPTWARMPHCMFRVSQYLCGPHLPHQYMSPRPLIEREEGIYMTASYCCAGSSFNWGDKSTGNTN